MNTAQNTERVVKKDTSAEGYLDALKGALLEASDRSC